MRLRGAYTYHECTCVLYITLLCASIIWDVVQWSSGKVYHHVWSPIYDMLVFHHVIPVGCNHPVKLYVSYYLLFVWLFLYCAPYVTTNIGKVYTTRVAYYVECVTHIYLHLTGYACYRIVPCWVTLRALVYTLCHKEPYQFVYFYFSER